MDQMTPERLRAERDLLEWALAIQRRDEIIRQAWKAGVSKHHIHVITGLARTTVDRIVGENQR